MKPDKRLLNAIQDYEQTIKQIEIRRNQWDKKVRSKIIDFLFNTKGFFQTQWMVDLENTYSNYETVLLKPSNINSGIVENRKTKTGEVIGKKMLEKSEGFLAFAQSYNGKIQVLIGYPSIELINENKEIEFVQAIDPEEINEEFMLEILIVFLEKMKNWENLEEKKIGFK
jgi:hypothetical protein